MDMHTASGVLLRLLPDIGDRALARAGDHAALAALAGAARIRHRCPACGADDHGTPEAVLADGTPAAVHVSLSRAGGWVLLAASSSGRVGVDLEEVARVAASGFDDVAFDEGERAMLEALGQLAPPETAGPDEGQRMRARLWSAKEAILKAAGTGLRSDPRALGIEPGADGRLRLVRSAVPGIRPETIELHEIDAPPGLVGLVCIAHDDPRRQSFGSALP